MSLSFLDIVVVIYQFKDVDVPKYNRHLLFVSKLLKMMENKPVKRKQKQN
jgi:hypothetical protein